MTDGFVVPVVVVVETGTRANFLLFKFDAEIPNGALGDGWSMIFTTQLDDTDNDDDDVVGDDMDDDGVNIDCDWIKVEPSSSFFSSIVLFDETATETLSLENVVHDVDDKDEDNC